jgi:hypothetical protein
MFFLMHAVPTAVPTDAVTTSKIVMKNVMESLGVQEPARETPEDMRDSLLVVAGTFLTKESGINAPERTLATEICSPPSDFHPFVLQTDLTILLTPHTSNITPHQSYFSTLEMTFCCQL